MSLSASAKFLLGLASVCGGSTCAFAAADLNHQIALTRAVKDIALSGDGQTIAATVTDTTEQGGHLHLWLYSPDHAAHQASTDAGADDSSPAWSPDNRYVFFIEQAAGTSSLRRLEAGSGAVQIFSLNKVAQKAQGGWQKTIPGVPLQIKGYALAPDGALAIWAVDGAQTSQGRRDKDDDYVYGAVQKVRLYLVGDTGEVREIPLPNAIQAASWSPDGQRLLVTGAPLSDDLGDPSRMWTVDRNGTATAIGGTPARIGAAAWSSPASIVYLATCAHDAPLSCQDLYAQRLDGTAPRNLTEGIKGSPTAMPVIDGDGHVLLSVAQGFEQHIARIRLSDGQTDWVAGAPPIVRSITGNPAHSAYALVAAERGTMPAIVWSDARLSRFQRLAGPDMAPSGWAPLQGRALSWVNEGRTIEGRLYLPPTADAHHHVPLIVDVHGGPSRNFDDTDYPLIRLLAERGWAVLHVNPRGSSGYGADFMATNRNDLGGADYRDIMAGVDAALTQAPLDPSRMAFIGYSFGGTTAAFTLGRTQRFKAIVSVAPVIEQIAEYGQEESSWYDRWYFGKPWRNLEAAWRQSPLSGVANAKTPLLLLQGDQDVVDPPSQALTFYRALRQEGSPVELVMFPREGHYEIGQNFYGLPSTELFHGIALRQRVITFLAAHLGQ